MIAHRLSTIRGADVILVMERRPIVEQGTHEELLGRGRRLRAPLQLAVRRRHRRVRALPVFPWAKLAPDVWWIPDRLWCSPFGLGHKPRPQGEGLLFASGDRRPAVPSECTGGAGPRCWQQ